jgi:uncharacterized membrane protein
VLLYGAASLMDIAWRGNSARAAGGPAFAQAAAIAAYTLIITVRLPSSGFPSVRAAAEERAAARRHRAAVSPRATLMEYLAVKWVHILSSTVLFGTGLGSAFYMFFASRTRDPRAVAVVVRHVVVADWLFTAPTLVLQPSSGLYLVHLAGMDSIANGLSGPSVSISRARAGFPSCGCRSMRDIAADAAKRDVELPPVYWSYLKSWVATESSRFLWWQCSS